VLTFAISNYFIKHNTFGFEPITRPDIFEGVHDLLAAGVLLVAELVGGEGQDDQLVSVLLAELVHLREVTDGRAS